MYFSKGMQRNLIKRIVAENYKVYDLRLNVGVFVEDGYELKIIVDTMFRAWLKIVCSRSRGIIRKFDGIMRRLFFEWSETQAGWSPYFRLICVQRQKLLSEEEEYKSRLEEETLRISTYIKWLSSWVTALKLCTDVSVGFSVLALDELEKSVFEFCANEKYPIGASVDKAKANILKYVCGNHHLVSFHGVFREMAWHVSVGR